MKTSPGVRPVRERVVPVTVCACEKSGVVLEGTTKTSKLFSLADGAVQLMSAVEVVTMVFKFVGASQDGAMSNTK